MKIKSEDDIRTASDVSRWVNGEGPYSMGIAIHCINLLLKLVPMDKWNPKL